MYYIVEIKADSVLNSDSLFVSLSEGKEANFFFFFFFPPAFIFPSMGLNLENSAKYLTCTAG